MGPFGAKAAGTWIARQAVRRGLLGSSRLWMAVFVAQGAFKLGRRVMGAREPVTVLEERLDPGAGIEIRHMKKGRG